MDVGQKLRRAGRGCAGRAVDGAAGRVELVPDDTAEQEDDEHDDRSDRRNHQAVLDGGRAFVIAVPVSEKHPKHWNSSWYGWRLTVVDGAEPPSSPATTGWSNTRYDAIGCAAHKIRTLGY